MSAQRSEPHSAAPRTSAVRLKITLLGACQAMAMTCMMLLVTMAGVASIRYLDAGQYSTLPVSAMFLGTMLFIIPASLLMKRMGRKKGFIIGQIAGVFSGLCIELALSQKMFILFIVGSFSLGIFMAFVQYYRFAAVDSVPQEWKSKAISLVLFGGVISAVAGPNLARLSESSGWSYMFFGSGICIALLALASIVILLLLDISEGESTLNDEKPRPAMDILLQRNFLYAVIIGAAGFSVMTMMMNGTPVAMVAHGLSFSSSATVIQWHVVAMFLPSLYTGNLIQRFGANTIVIVGYCILGFSLTCALLGIHYSLFAASATLLGIGWNFLYVGGTTLITQAYRPSEKNVAQAINDFIVFGTNVSASFFAGYLILGYSWEVMTYFGFSILLCSAVSLIILKFRETKYSYSVS